MKRFLVLLGLSLFCLNSVIAQPARFLIDEVDPFTGIKVLQTNSFWSTSSVEGTKTYIEYLVNIQDNISNLIVRLHKVDNFISMDNGSYHLMAVDSNGNVVTLNGSTNVKVDNEQIKTSSVHWGFGISSSANKKYVDISLTFPINKNITEHPIIHDIQRIRIVLGEMTFDCQLQKEDRKRIAKLFKLVTPHL